MRRANGRTGNTRNAAYRTVVQGTRALSLDLAFSISKVTRNPAAYQHFPSPTAAKCVALLGPLAHCM